MNIWIIIGAAVALFGLVCLASLVIDNHRFVVRRYPVHTDKVDAPITYVFISDLHNKVYGNNNETVYSAIKDLHPDAILVGGDMTIAKPCIHKAIAGELTGMDEAIMFLSKLPDIAPTYLANGNHEQRIYETGFKYTSVKEVYDHFVDELQKMGIHQLHNQSIEYNNHIVIYGYEHACEHYEKIWSNPIPEGDLNEKIGTPDPNKFNILMAHNPKFYETYDQWGADLVLSGHVHGGLMRIGRLGFIAPDLHLFPKYSGGSYFAGNGSEMILTCGLGAHTLPIRIFNPGEISVVEIIPEKQ